MREVYYNPMRIPAIVVAFFAAAFLAAGTSRPPQATLKAAALESHEGVTISAQPWTDPAQYKQKFPKKSPFAVGILAIQLTLRNDSEQSVKIDLESIRLNVLLSEDNRQGLLPLRPEDVADLVMNAGNKDPTAKRKTFPFPGNKPSVGHDKHWTEIQEAASQAGMPGTIVPPQRSLQGLLYFNLQGQLDLLSTAHLYIPSVTALEKNHPLLYFEIDLSRPPDR